ncbi:MAG: zinc carboxypeptidase [Bacteroidetes bacterium]|nr:zinc carboxypeptidase [Bacteroidota bacterium]
MRKSFVFLTFLICSTSWAQVDLSYYLPPNTQLNPAIPSPQSVIGHQVGEWHITHDRLVNYMVALDKASDRISLEVIGQSHEVRPILLLTITSPKNHQNLEAIRADHAALSDPQKSGSLNIKNMPAVFYMGHSIHGNEASGANAALLTAYYLAAAQGPEIENYLSNTIILFDPSFNPDGLQRFSSWVNARKSMLVNADPNDVEHNEAWPGGRFNHYWFDLNRDWLVAQHPESQARVKKFHAWKPNVLTDHHEMGTNATFFFQPGVPSRMHPLTPEKNLELTKKIGAFHAKALDEIGSLYYTQEGYDDFYYGKGSTFPDVQGAIGILFEQASSRGHAQESVNGILRFPFTIRNQFTTALSTLKAVNELRVELLEYQRDFYSNASAEAVKDPVKAIVVSSPKDKMKLFHFGEMLARQQIGFYKPTGTQTLAGKNVDSESGYVIPLNQPQYRLIKSMFEKRTQFKDSLFYDISSWTLPLAFGIDYEEQKVMPSLGEKITNLKSPEGKIIGKGDYAYVIEPFGYYVPRATYRLLSKNVRVKVATENFYANGKKFERGSLLISVDHQERLPDQLEVYMKEITEKDGLDVYALSTGLDFQGVSLGSPSFLSLKKPEIAMLVESGISPTDAGEIWHVLDTRYQIPVTLLPISVFNTTNINRYNTLIIPEGNYNAISESTKEKLKTWTQNGGVVIGFENAINWFQSTGLGKFETKKEDEGKKDQKPKPYADIEENRGAQETSGAIFEADADLTNPLLYGFSSSKIALFKPNNIFLTKASGSYANPLTFGSSPLLSGYISKPNYARLKNSSSLGIAAVGRGRVIGFTENLSFRAFWYGTNKIMMNAIFFGPLLSSESSR